MEGSVYRHRFILWGVSVRRIDVIWFKCPGIEVMLSDTGPFGNKTIALLFNIVPRSVLKAKQRIKNKLALSATDSLDMHIQQC